MSDLERIPDRQDKWSNFQKKYNTTTKTIATVIGSNLSMVVCLLLPLLMIGFIWTDVGIVKLGTWYITDAALTLALFIVGELMMMRVGAAGGKLDNDYIAAKNEYMSLVDSVNKLGTLLFPLFCEWQVDNEYNRIIAKKLRRIKVSRDEWDNVRDRPYRKLKRVYGKYKAHVIRALNHVKAIDLNEAVLLCGETEEDTRGIPMSGEDYMHKKSHSIDMIIGAGFTCLLTVSIAFTLTTDISIARVVYTITRLAFLMFRMTKGYQTGAKSYNTIEVFMLRAKSKYLRQYEKFVEDKIYLNLGNKYGDIRMYTAEYYECGGTAPKDEPVVTEEIVTEDVAATTSVVPVATN